MSPFTLLLSRLTSELGAEKAAAIVLEFGGLQISFPASSPYQIAAVGNDSIAHQQVTEKTLAVFDAPLDSPLARASACAITQLQTVAYQLTHSTQALQLHAKQLERLHSIVSSEIESLTLHLTDS